MEFSKNHLLFHLEIGDGYIITSLPARHEFGNDARIYIIEKDGKTILYAHDTGIIYDEIYKYIEENKIHVGNWGNSIY